MLEHLLPSHEHPEGVYTVGGEISCVVEVSALLVLFW